MDSTTRYLFNTWWPKKLQRVPARRARQSPHVSNFISEYKQVKLLKPPYPLDKTLPPGTLVDVKQKCSPYPTLRITSFQFGNGSGYSKLKSADIQPTTDGRKIRLRRVATPKGTIGKRGRQRGHGQS